MSKPTFNLLGEIVADDSARWFDSDVVPAMVIGWLKNQNDADVEININSPGGDATAGIAIANAIKAYKGHVTANVLGIAASAASVIACAADEVRMGDGAFLMIHNPWCASLGDADDLRHDAEVLDKLTDSIVGFYQSKSTKSADELKTLLAAETWLSFDDMVEQGFSVERYTEEFKAAACATRRAFDKAPAAARRFFSAVPSDWSRRFSGLQAAKDKEIAALRDELAAAGEQHKAAEAQLTETHAAALEAVNAERDELKAQVSELRSEIENLKADIGAKQKALDEANAAAKQLEAKCAEAEKALAETQAALADETKRYREQIGLALQQPKKPEAKGEQLIRCTFPGKQ